LTAPKRILALLLCLVIMTAVFGGLQITADETEEGIEIVSTVNENQTPDYEEYLQRCRILIGSLIRAGDW